MIAQIPAQVNPIIYCADEKYQKLLFHLFCAIINYTLYKVSSGFDLKGGFFIYKIGDHLAHPGHGGCTIQKIEKRDFGGKTALYFVMTPTGDPQTTILAPVDNVEKIGFRDLISVKEADRILSLFSAQIADWDSDSKKRQQAYQGTMKNGKLEDIAKMIHEMLVYDKKSVLGDFDRTMLPKAQKKLYSEIALVKGMDISSVVNIVNNMMV